jgi:hypothetical protein
MAKKNHFLIVDTETTQDSLVADFAAVIVDKHGNIVTQCAILVNGIFTDMEQHPLFHSFGDSNDIWSKAGLPARYARYNKMVEAGSRMVATPAAINRWLDKAAAQYAPILTAYNLAFDREKCGNTGIDLTQFPRSFCLWQAAYTEWAHTKKYREAALALHAFNAPTKHGNMSYKTNAETIARFCTGNLSLEDEPHTALEDIVYYELPILVKLLKKRSARWLLESPRAYNWRDCQVRDWFTA